MEMNPITERLEKEKERERGVKRLKRVRKDKEERNKREWLQSKVESGCGNSNPQDSTGVELYRACIDIYALD